MTKQAIRRIMGSRISALLLALSFSIVATGCLGSSTRQSKAASSTITSITLTPQNPAVTVGKTLQFSAQATYSDGSSKDITSIATWATSDSSLATVSSGGLVKGMKIGAVNVGVGSGNVKATALVNVTTKSFNRASLKGSYAFKLTGETTQARFEVGSINADGAGNFTGIEDINSATGVVRSAKVSGTYTVLADGRGTLTWNTAGEPSRNFHFVLFANSATPADNNAKLIQFDKAGTAVGELIRQDNTAFANVSLANHEYVFRVGGLDSTQHPISTVGEFSVDASGTNVTSGEEDENDNGTVNGSTGPLNPVSISSGTIGAIDANTGRGALSLTAGGTSSNFALYVVGAGKVELIGLDSSPMVYGEAELQVSGLASSATAGGYTFATEIGGTGGQFWIMGQFQLGTTGQITSLFQRQDGGLSLNWFPGGGFGLGTNGRGFLQESTDQGLRTFIAYLVSATRMYVLQSDDAHAGSGIAELQEPGLDGFSTGTLNNSFVLSAADTSDGNLAIVGQVVADGAGHLTGIIDVSQPQPGNPSQLTVSTVVLTATYSSPSTSGITVGSVTSQGTGLQAFAMFLGSSNRALILGISPTDVNGSIALQ
jgi:hypothetical protein